MARRDKAGPGPRVRPEQAAPQGAPGPEAGAGTKEQAGGTSGQSVPKSKFRQKSRQEQAAASKLRMEKRGEKLEAAKGKLAKQKPQKKPGPVKRAGGALGGSVHGFVHGKIYEVEQENVGTEGAHHSELLGESAFRQGSRFVGRRIREHPARAVRRAEARYGKAAADYQFYTAAQEHPELSKNALSRYWQKRRLRKQYQKRAKEAARQGAVAAEKTAAATEKLSAQAVGFVKRHPLGVLLALACVLLILSMQSCSSALVLLGNAGAGAVGATTYPSPDGEILAAEAAYLNLEAELQNYLDTYTSTHNYDEYHFDLDEIEHDPYVLISILCVLHEGEWTAAQVQGTLGMLFDRQYILTERVVVETRYDSDDEPYSWYICYVTLENFDLSHLPVYFMGEEQLARYQTYFLNTVDEADLLAAAEAAGVELASCSCPDKCAAGAVNTNCAVCAVNMTECAGVEQKPEPEPEPVAEPDAEPETEKGNAGMLLLVLAVAVLGGGAAFYFKVYRPKQQAATEPEEDYGEELEDYDGEEDGPPWDEDEDENEDTEDGE